MDVYFGEDKVGACSSCPLSRYSLALLLVGGGLSLVRCQIWNRFTHVKTLLLLPVPV